MVRLELALRFSVSSSSVFPRSKFRVDAHADAYLPAAQSAGRKTLASVSMSTLHKTQNAKTNAQRFDLLRLSRHVGCKGAAERRHLHHSRFRGSRAVHQLRQVLRQRVALLQHRRLLCRRPRGYLRWRRRLLRRRLRKRRSVLSPRRSVVCAALRCARTGSGARRLRSVAACALERSLAARCRSNRSATSVSRSANMSTTPVWCASMSPPLSAPRVHAPPRTRFEASAAAAAAAAGAASFSASMRSR